MRTIVTRRNGTPVGQMSSLTGWQLAAGPVGRRTIETMHGDHSCAMGTPSSAMRPNLQGRSAPCWEGHVIAIQSFFDV